MLNDFRDLVGQTLTDVKNVDNVELVFTLSSGEKYSLNHHQDCCESVMIEDIVGSLEDLVGSPILMADEASNSAEDSEGWESSTWTFYKLATIKGYVTIRWLGTSNGYYSEGVSWDSIKED